MRAWISSSSRFVDLPASNARLVGHDDETITQITQCAQSSGGALKQFHVVWIGKVVTLLDDRPVAVEHDKTAYLHSTPASRVKKSLAAA